MKRLIALIASLMIVSPSFGQSESDSSKTNIEGSVIVTSHQIRLILNELYLGDSYKQQLDVSLNRNDLLSFYLAEKDREIFQMKREKLLLERQVESVRDQGDSMKDMLDVCTKEKRRIRINAIMIGGGVCIAVTGVAVLTTFIALQ